MTLPFFSPRVCWRETWYAAQIVRSGWLNQGPITRDFEQALAEVSGYHYAVCTTSGTAAITLGLLAAGIGPDDRVGVPDTTYVATANAVRAIGAEVVLLDVDANFRIAEDQSPRTLQAFIPVNVNGMVTYPSEWLNTEIERVRLYQKDFVVLGDATESLIKDAHNAIYNTLALSFSPNKIITTGQGGALLTNDGPLAETARLIRNQGRLSGTGGGDDRHIRAGWNFKFTDVQAAIGLQQLRTIDSRINFIRDRNELYERCLPMGIRDHYYDQLWTQVTITHGRRAEVVAALASHGYETRTIWRPLHEHPAYKDDPAKFPGSSSLAETELWLPSGYDVRERHIRHIAKIIRGVLKS